MESLRKAGASDIPFRRRLHRRWGVMGLVIAGMSASPMWSQEERLRIVSYNVENLFDTVDDPLTDDEAFLSGGAFHWTEDKYRRKIGQTASVIADIGEWDYPALVGLIEVENQTVVSDLADHQRLRRQDYRMAVSRGADPRGIDVALLWHPRHFRQVAAYEIPHYGRPLCYPLRRDPRPKHERYGTGRNTLWVVLESKKTGMLLDVLVVHLPSRRGGTRSTSEKRGAVCGKIRRVLDHIVRMREVPRVVLMGDFNDSPSNVAVKDSLRTFSVSDADGKYLKDRLYNLSAPLEKTDRGSHYFGNAPWLPDQIMVSGALLDEAQDAHVRPAVLRIFCPDYMKQGQRPKRSFRGTRYSGGGFSDHFPVYVDLIVK